MLSKTIGSSLVIVFLIVLVGIGNAASLGVSVANPESPGEWDMFFRSMLRGGYAEREITIGSSTGNTPLDVIILVDSVFKDWITFEPGNNFTITPGTPFKLTAIVQPPEDVQNGIYSGLVTVRAFPSANASGNSSNRMTVAAAVALKTAVEITGDQLLSWAAKKISVASTEEGLPIKVSVSIANIGNVKANPKIIVDILNQDKSSVLKSMSFVDNKVLPSKTDELTLDVPSSGLAIGQYWADVKVYNGDNLSKESVLTFDILEKGSLRIVGDLVQVWCPTWVVVGDVVKINAIFENTGELITSATFKGEVRLGDRLVDVLESDEVDTPIGGRINVTMYYTPKESGRYVIGGYVVYSKKITGIKECILNVQPAGTVMTGAATGMTSIGFDWPIALAAAVVLVAAFVVFRAIKSSSGKASKKR